MCQRSLASLQQDPFLQSLRVVSGCKTKSNSADLYFHKKSENSTKVSSKPTVIRCKLQWDKCLWAPHVFGGLCFEKFKSLQQQCLAFKTQALSCSSNANCSAESEANLIFSFISFISFIYFWFFPGSFCMERDSGREFQLTLETYRFMFYPILSRSPCTW